MEAGPEALPLLVAARALGLTENALRKRLRRGSLPEGVLAASKTDGEWLVTLAGPAPGHGRGEAGTGQATSGPATEAQAGPATPDGALVATLQAELRQVWAALEREQLANAEMRRLLQQRLQAPPIDTTLTTLVELPPPAVTITQSPPPPRRKGWLRRQWGKLAHGEP